VRAGAGNCKKDCGRPKTAGSDRRLFGTLQGAVVFDVAFSDLDWKPLAIRKSDATCGG